LGNGRGWNDAGTVNTPKKEASDEQTVLLSKCGRKTHDGCGMVVHHTVCGDPVVMEIFSHIMVMEIVLAWLWLIGIVAFLILVGYLLQGRQDEQSSRGPDGSGDRLLPDRIELFRQRRHQQHPIFKRLYCHLSHSPLGYSYA